MRSIVILDLIQNPQGMGIVAPSFPAEAGIYTPGVVPVIADLIRNPEGLGRDALASSFWT